jgi:hypothetical protein
MTVNKTSLLVKQLEYGGATICQSKHQIMHCKGGLSACLRYSKPDTVSAWRIARSLFAA